MKFQDYLQERQAHLDKVLTVYLPNIQQEPTRLHQAMHYAVLNGGKRLRPLLVYATGETFGASIEQLDAAACAIEFIHAYSLVHDDLPAMDNDDFRRGKLTCHKAFDEATAILAGDALQVLAFEIMLAAKYNPQALLVLAKAAGTFGMAGGQAMEFALTEKELTLDQLTKIHQLKTGALIAASVKLGALLSQVSEVQLAALEQYASCLGLAFQIQDDIQDDATSNTLFSYPRLIGLAAAQEKVFELYKQALSALSSLHIDAELLIGLADYIILPEFR